ncbi:MULTISPECIES: RNA polymerase sigma factor [Chitinophagaceae]
MSAYLVVFKSYHNTIFSVALQYCKLKHLADDAAQQVFVELWEKRAILNTVEDPEAWLWVIARNQTIKILKKESTQKSYVEYMKEFFSDSSDTPVNQLILKQRSTLIEKIVNSLPTRQQQVYKLSRNEGLTYHQIASELSIGTETVKEHMAKALNNIRIALKKHEHELRTIMILFFYYFFS